MHVTYHAHPGLRTDRADSRLVLAGSTPLRTGLGPTPLRDGRADSALGGWLVFHLPSSDAEVYPVTYIAAFASSVHVVCFSLLVRLLGRIVCRWALPPLCFVK